MIKENILVLRINIDDYYFPFIKDDFNVHRTMESKYDHLYMLVSNKIGLRFQGYGRGWIHHIKNVNKVILFDYGWNDQVTKYIKRINPQCIVHIFYFNKISNPTHYKILEDKNVDKIWTFDISDAKEFGLFSGSIMYSEKVAEYIESNQILSDIVFVGGAKNRETVVEKVKQACFEQGLKIDFNVIHKKEDYISYPTYLDKISKSRCILDITVPGQTGLTLRFMEALFLGKKIITNNRAILDYPDLYNENNVFIIDNNLNSITEFMQREYIPYPQNTIDYYDFRNWIERFKL